jgi:septal ring factor EnvC (AmiA/AmiB activator)
MTDALVGRELTQAEQRLAMMHAHVASAEQDYRQYSRLLADCRTELAEIEGKIAQNRGRLEKLQAAVKELLKI